MGSYHRALLSEPALLPGMHAVDALLVRLKECLGRTWDELLHEQVHRRGQVGFRTMGSLDDSWDAVLSTLISAADAAWRAAKVRAMPLHVQQPVCSEMPLAPPSSSSGSSRSGAEDDDNAVKVVRDRSLDELTEITCKTHKCFATRSQQSAALGKQGSVLAVRRTGGFLVACSPNGIILGVESLAGFANSASM